MHKQKSLRLDDLPADIVFSETLRRDTRYIVKKIYQLLANRSIFNDDFHVQWRIAAIQFLERLLKTDFKNTRDFKAKIEGYLKNYDVRKGSAGRRIKIVRKRKGWTQKDLARHLGYSSHVPIVNFEKDIRYPPEKVFLWLKEEGM